MSGGGSSRQGPGAPLVGRDEDVEFIHSFVNQAAIPPGETCRAPGRWCAVFANRDDPAVRELKMLYDAVAPSSCPAGWQADLTAVARPRAPWARTRTWSVRRMPRGPADQGTALPDSGGRGVRCRWWPCCRRVGRVR